MTFIRHLQAKLWFIKGHCGSNFETEKNMFKVQEIIYFPCDRCQKVQVFFHICVGIKRNESYVGHIDFEIHPIIV